jgi:hypothetical protein
MPVALAIEALVAFAGLYLFVSGAALSRPRKLWISVLSLLVFGFTAIGMTVAPPPPSVTAMAATSLVTIVVVSLLAGWLAKPPRWHELRSQ